MRWTAGGAGLMQWLLEGRAVYIYACRIVSTFPSVRLEYALLQALRRCHAFALLSHERHER